MTTRVTAPGDSAQHRAIQNVWLTIVFDLAFKAHPGLRHHALPKQRVRAVTNASGHRRSASMMKRTTEATVQGSRDSARE